MRHAPATQRNRDPILAVLQQILPPAGFLLEIASGTGEHAAYMAPRLPGWTWQPSDREPDTQSIDGHSRAAGARNVRPAMRLDVTEPLWPITSADAILCCNMIHIASWTAAEGPVRGRSADTDWGRAAGPVRTVPAARPAYGAFERSLRRESARPGSGMGRPLPGYRGAAAGRNARPGMPGRDRDARQQSYRGVPPAIAG